MRYVIRMALGCLAAVALLAGCGGGGEKANVALLDAVRKGEADRAVELVGKHASPSYADPKTGETPIGLVLQRIEQRWSAGQTADAGDARILRSFVEAGTKLPEGSAHVLGAVQLKDGELVEPLFRASSQAMQEAALIWVLREHDLELVQRLRGSYTSGWSYQSSAAADLLADAIRQRDGELALAILAFGAPRNDSQIVTAAAEARLGPVIKALVGAGVDAGPALEQAAASGKLSAVRSLIEAGVPASAGAPLAYAVYNGHWDMVDYLLGQGADVNAKAELPTLYGSALDAYVHEEYYGRFQPIAEKLPMPLRSSLVLENTGGAAVLKVVGKRLYVATERGNFIAFDLADPASPRVLGALALSARALCLEARDNGLLYAGTDAGVLILDTSDPHALREQGLWKTDYPVTHLRMRDANLYALSQDVRRETALVYRFDRSGRAPDKLLSRRGRVSDLVDIGGELHVVESQGADNEAINVTTGKHIYLWGTVAATDPGDGPRGTSLGERLFSVKWGQLNVDKVSRAEGNSGPSLAPVGSTRLGPFGSPLGARILFDQSPSGPRVYVTTDGGVEVFDATEPPALPRLAGLLEIQDAHDIAVADDALYVATAEGVHVTNIPAGTTEERKPIEDPKAVVLAALEQGDAATVRRMLALSYDPSDAILGLPSDWLEYLQTSRIASENELDVSYESGSRQYWIPSMSERLEAFRNGRIYGLPLELHDPLYLAIYYAADAYDASQMVRAVRRLVLNGEDPNGPYGTGQSGRSPLAAAILIADVPAVVEALLNSTGSPRSPRADANYKFRMDVPDLKAFGRITPLGALVSVTGHGWQPYIAAHIAKMLLESGADPLAPAVRWGVGAGEQPPFRIETSIPELIDSWEGDNELARLIRERTAGQYTEDPGYMSSAP